MQQASNVNNYDFLGTWYDQKDITYPPELQEEDNNDDEDNDEDNGEDGEINYDN